MQDMSRFFFEDGVRLALAVVMGGVIGLEREASDKPAGLRTNILICVGSTLMMILSIDVARNYAIVSADPGRIAQGVITGIGFLGAGTILHSRGGVVGLTTAATTWAVAGIGLALGSGFYMLAATTTLLILAVLWVFGRAAHLVANGKGPRTSFRIVTDGSDEALDSVRALLQREGVVPVRWDASRLRSGYSLTVECAVPGPSVATLVSRLISLPQVLRARTL
jgi:putative Mg2+ transporter-C (MgtC) family protein